jgi:excisionase family DNA binding protein
MQQGDPLPLRLITIQQAAGYTGLSPHTLYTMVSQRRIPYVKVGRLTKFDVGLLDDVFSQVRTYSHDTVTCHSGRKGGDFARPQENLRRCGGDTRQD